MQGYGNVLKTGDEGPRGSKVRVEFCIFFAFFTPSLILSSLFNSGSLSNTALKLLRNEPKTRFESGC